MAFISSWSVKKIKTEAEKEPERIKFWKPYFNTYLDACIAVVENPPSFDAQWKQMFPDPVRYKKGDYGH